MKDRNTLKNISKEVFQIFNEDLVERQFDSAFHVEDIEMLKSRVLEYSRHFNRACILNNNFKNSHNNSNFIAALGYREELSLDKDVRAFNSIRHFLDKHKDQWVFAALSYDLKNDVEDLSSENADEILFPSAHIFIPEILIFIKENEVFINSSKINAEEVFKKLLSIPIKTKRSKKIEKERFESRPSEEEYISKIKVINEEIKQGNIYEINYCKELLAEIEIDPYQTALNLNEISPAPFSVFYKYDDMYLICASPERFLLKNGKTLLSQPIKGTRPRSNDPVEDKRLKEELLHDTKERAENVMIVDLVRNDLSHTAERGSVMVSELFGIYSFPQVHQMISTISSKLKEDFHFVDSIKHCFPMGSMTGAPKLRAMKLIEEHEYFKRGLFSGSVGVITPNQNFDFNVVIRSILYNDKSKKLSIKTGSAITALCVPEKEWEECQLKAGALISSICLK